MYTNVNFPAALGALLFAGTVFLLLIFALITVVLTLRRKRALAKATVFAIMLLVAGYSVLLLVFSFASHEKLLARGEEKHFCEIDCHLAYSVAETRETKTLGDATNHVTAAGVFRVITIKTRFDRNTISSARGDSLLYPNSRLVTIVDDQSRQYLPSPAAQAVLEKAQQAGTVMTIPLRPGESYTTTLAFDVPSDLGHPTLLIREGESSTHFVIGHENSPLHKKTRFQI